MPRFIASIPKVVVSLLLVAAIVNLLIGVFLRYVMIPITDYMDWDPVRFTWVEEIGEMMLAYLTLIGAAIGLHLHFSKRLLACLLAFAAGALISALAIELAYEGARSLHQHGFDARHAWMFVSAGFALGATAYYFASLILEKKGAAVRYVTQFREYALARKQANEGERIRLLSSCDLMRHLPAEQIEPILHSIRDRQLKAEGIAQAGCRAMDHRTAAVVQRAAGDDARDPVPVLLPPRQVEAEAVFEPLDPFLVRGDLADVIVGRAGARDRRGDLKDQEGDDAREEHDDAAAEQPLDHVPDHRRATGGRSGSSPNRPPGYPSLAKALLQSRRAAVTCRPTYRR